jgi:hypothetical protein
MELEKKDKFAVQKTEEGRKIYWLFRISISIILIVIIALLLFFSSHLENNHAKNNKKTFEIQSKNYGDYCVNNTQCDIHLGLICNIKNFCNCEKKKNEEYFWHKNKCHMASTYDQNCLENFIANDTYQILT